MTMRRCGSLSRRLRTSKSGIAMIEFALLLPVLVILFFGTVEVTEIVIAKRRLNLLVYALGDLTSQSQTISASDFTNIFGAASTIIAPLSTASLQMRISSVIVYTTGKTCVDWSEVSGTGIAALQAGSTTYVLPTSIKPSTSSATQDFIVAEANLPYSTPTHGFLKNSVILKEGPTYIVPRQSTRVTGDTTIQASSPCAA
jgi:Flp pilus assembly protein TadG